MVAVVSVAPLLLAPFVLFTCSTAFGQEQERASAAHLALTLDDAVRLALQNNRSLIAQSHGCSRSISFNVAGESQVK